MPSHDILILSNGPGELTTWVRPVVKALRQQLGEDRQVLRISLVLAPCPNASGQEAEIARSYAGIDRVQAAEDFWPFLLWGKTREAWDWAKQGVVLFLGGDQFFSVVIGKRLGYKILIYGEWETRWHRWVDAFAVMKPALIQQAAPIYQPKFTVVGDLMADIQLPNSAANSLGSSTSLNANPDRPTANQPLTHQPVYKIGILPGSKAAKLAQGLPLGLAIAEQVQQVYPQTQFVIPVAPTLSLPELAKFADPVRNPILSYFGEVAADLIWENNRSYLQTQKGLRVELWTQSPAYELLIQCDLCLTTIGANTAELGALAVPMLVLMPIQQLDAMRAWDGLPGLLANLPGLGSLFAKLINRWFLRQTRLLAWPNIWAGEMIVPELIGELQPQEVAAQVLDWLAHPEIRIAVQQKLRQARGAAGAAEKLARLAQTLLKID